MVIDLTTKKVVDSRRRHSEPTTAQLLATLANKTLVGLDRRSLGPQQNHAHNVSSDLLNVSHVNLLGHIDQPTHIGKLETTIALKTS